MTQHNRIDMTSGSSDVYAREDQIFPKLTDDQLARASKYGEREQLAKGAAVFTRGDRSVDCFIITKGNIEIVDPSSKDEVITVHGARNFTGELDLFNDRKILVGGRMGEDGEVIRLSRPQFRRLLTGEPDIGEIITRALILRRVGLIQRTQGGVMLVGPRRSRDTLRLERFMRRNGYPVRALDPDRDPETRPELEALGWEGGLPVVFGAGDAPLENPSNIDLARALGIAEEPNPKRVRDVIVVGAGPSGLAAAVYAASEGLDTLVMETEAPGGQAGTSSKIENYLGFPTGISGQALAGRAQVQAQKFGATILLARQAAKLDCETRPYQVTTEDGVAYQARTVVIASGATYRSLNLDNVGDYEGAGIHYAATALEADLCRAEEVVVVGGGNSAGQAAVFLSRHAKHVHMLIRSGDLAASMSDYLVGRIDASPDITLHRHTEIVALRGERYLEQMDWRNNSTGEVEMREISNLFLMIGAVPNTRWLDGCVALDKKGFVLTGAQAADYWPLERVQEPLETSRPGVFAVGDARATSVKRVASAVGEGSIAVQFLHRVLAEDA